MKQKTNSSQPSSLEYFQKIAQVALTNRLVIAIDLSQGIWNILSPSR